MFRYKIYNVWILVLRSDLTHWVLVTHVCFGKLTIIGWDNGLSPGQRQAIISTNAGILLIGPLGTNFSEILITIRTFSLKKIRLKMSSATCSMLLRNRFDYNISASEMGGKVISVFRLTADHCNDAIIGAMTSHITSLTIVYPPEIQAQIKKHQSSASLAFVRGIHR